jgi:hypothetical protein
VIRQFTGLFYFSTYTRSPLSFTVIFFYWKKIMKINPARSALSRVRVGVVVRPTVK